MPIIISRSRIKSYYVKFAPVLQDARASAYFMLILSLFSLSFFGGFAIRPTLETITQLQRQINDSQVVYDKLKEKNKNLLTLQSEYKKIEKDLPTIYAALPRTVDAPTFLLKVRTLASAYNITIVSLQLGKSPLSGQEDSKQISNPSAFSLTAGGAYKDMEKFLTDLAHLDRLVTLSSIELTTSGVGSNINELTLQLSGNIYTLFD